MPGMPLELTFIGTGNAFAPGGLCWNGFLANRRYLFEAPPQALMALHRVDVDPNAVEAVVLSHHHGDHFLGLPFLLLHWKHRGRETPVTIVGPPETERLAREIGETVYPGLFESDFGIEWRELVAGDSATVGDLTVEAVAVEHDDRLSLNLGYHARLGRRARFAYTGDTRRCDAVLDLAREADVLVAECASRDIAHPHPHEPGGRHSRGARGDVPHGAARAHARGCGRGDRPATDDGRARLRDVPLLGEAGAARERLR